VPCQAIINHAAEGELCQHIKVKRFKVEKKIKSPFTIEWVDVFCRHATPHLSALTLFMFATGARISEALAVEWDHVDLRRCTALIPKSKISEQRQVNLPQRLMVAIANLPRIEGRPVFFYRKRGDLHKSLGRNNHTSRPKAIDAAQWPARLRDDGPQEWRGSQDRGLARRLEEHPSLHGDLRPCDRRHHIE
jgi:integrase